MPTLGTKTVMQIQKIILGALLLVVSFAGCRENFTLSPNPAPAGATVTLTSFSLGATQGQNSVLYDGTPAEIVSWSNSEVKFKVPANKANGTYTVSLVIKAPNPIETVTKPHTVDNGAQVSFQAYNLDDEMGGVATLRDVQYGGNNTYCVLFDDAQGRISTTSVNTTTGVFTPAVHYNTLSGSAAVDSASLSSNCAYLSGASDPATGWQMNNSTAVAQMSPGEGTGTYAVNNSGTFVGNLGGLGGAFRWSSTTGRTDLASVPGGFSALAAAIDNSGNVFGSAPDAEFNVSAVVWPNGSTSPIILPGQGNYQFAMDATGDGRFVVGNTGDLGNEQAAIWDTQALQFVFDGDVAPGGGGELPAAPGNLVSVASNAGLTLAGGGLGAGPFGGGQLGSAFLVCPETSGWMKHDTQPFLANKFSYSSGPASSVRGLVVNSDYVVIGLGDDSNGAAANQIIFIPRSQFEAAMN